MNIENKLENPIIQYKYKNKRSKNGFIHKEKVAVLVAGVNPEYPEYFTVGFALCDPRDRFDHITINGTNNTIHKKNFGKTIALRRAEKWAKPTLSDFPYEYTVIDKNKISRTLGVPMKLINDFKSFVIRSQKYYKDKKPMPWVLKAM